MKAKNINPRATRQVALLMALSIGAAWLMVAAPASAESGVQAPQLTADFSPPPVKG